MVWCGVPISRWDGGGMVGWWDGGMGGMGGMAGMVVWWYGGMAGMGVVQLPGKRNISCNCSTATPGLPATPEPEAEIVRQRVSIADRKVFARPKSFCA